MLVSAFRRMIAGAIVCSALSTSARGGPIVIFHGEGHGEGDSGKELEASEKAGVGGSGPFFSSNVTLLAHMPLTDIGGTSGVLGNDIWGWTDPMTGREYALYGRSDGTSFIDISTPTAPVYLGDLPTHTGNAAWRDIKVMGDHALIVADGNGNHGMQVFDLTNLRGVTSVTTFTETAHYGGYSNAHNIAVNEQTGYAYAVGTNTASGGLHIIDVSDPTNPTAAGTFSADGYTHDTQVVAYQGPDADYAGREIAFNSNEDTLTIVDVTSKQATAQISRTGYSQSGYAHQGWLTEDQRYFLMNDEFDEVNFNTGTRTHIWDVSDLDAPVYLGHYESSLTSRDHNLYVHNGLIYEANYTTGLRILEPVDLSQALVTEVGYFDTYPTDDARTFNGAWSVYPYFKSGSIIVNDRQNGLFVLAFDAVAAPEPGALPLCLAGLAVVLGYAGCRRRFIKSTGVRDRSANGR
ncbi:MAG: choice-of-anchor B family protein [Planctomycetaceae bacterium]